MQHRPLGASGIEVSALALGSWQTYERIPREQGVAVLQAARAAGIDFLEVALERTGFERYDLSTPTRLRMRRRSSAWWRRSPT